MAYDILKTIIWVISIIFTVISLHFFVFAIIGLVTYKKYPKAKEKHRYGIIIPARNEEKVVAGLIESCLKNDYPQDKLEIFVIAHNCTDKTAEIARKYGVHVYEYNNEKEKTKGYALKYIFEQIDKQYGVKNFNGFFVFDADNILSKNYFDKMNDAFEAEGMNNVITSFRNSKNFGTNAISSSYGILFFSGCLLEGKGRTVCNCSTRVQGTGYVIPAEIVKDGWNYVTLTEDWEFSADQILQGRKIKYCNEAVFYDEQPTSLKVMWRQRVRWARGHILVCLTKWFSLFAKIFSRKKTGEYSNRFSAYDMMVNITPQFIINCILLVVQIIMLTVCSIIQLDGVVSLWQNLGMSWATSALTTLVSNFLIAVAVFIWERKRIQKVSVGLKILTCLSYPFFRLLDWPLQIVALFSKNLAWKTIPHKDQTNFDEINNVQETNQDNIIKYKEKLEEINQNNNQNDIEEQEEVETKKQAVSK